MGRENRKLPASMVGGPKERHKRALRSQYDPTAPVPEGLVAKPAIPKSKHHSYFEFVENKDKKKKLEYQVTSTKHPPPGFEFVPIGNPELTTACKELSRDKDAMIFIVSNSKEVHANHLAHQVHRIGHHIRETIVDEARARLGQKFRPRLQISNTSPEPIPASQTEYNAQVDAAIRDLFPRIPNTDRQMIIEHAFRRGTTFKGEKPVGFAEDITLARRVQLATLAHIRHTHTRYDTLLRETSWQNARKVVEALCLDTLVKWRGDEETGRDQLDEILREVVVISDSEDEDSGEETDDSSIAEVVPPPKGVVVPIMTASNAQGQASPSLIRSPKTTPNQNGPLTPARAKGNVKKANRKKTSGKKEKRGFKRYNAWQEAIQRYRDEQGPEPRQSPMDCRPDYGPGPYHQLATRVAAPYTPNPAQEGFQRIASEGAGPAPNENGYVAHPPTSYSRPPLNPAPHSYSVPPRQPMYEKVISPSHPLSPKVPSPRRPANLAVNPLQDMLVRSIEPGSPDAMRPSFVRSVPPRSQGYRDYSPAHANMQYSPRILSPLRGPVMRDEPPFAGRRVVSDRLTPGLRNAGGYHGDSSPQTSRLPHEREYVSSHVGQTVSASPLYHPTPRAQEPSRPSLMAPQNIYRDGPRPGGRSNPILMEDRGGFFERVPTHQDGGRPLPRDAEIASIRRSGQEIRRATEPHRVVGWEEGSRILRENQGRAGVEIIPIGRDHPIPHEPRTHTLLTDAPITRRLTPDSLIREPVMEREPYPICHQRLGLETRPVSGERISPRYQPFEEIRRHDVPPQPQYGESVQRHYVHNSPAMNGQHDPQRRYPIHPPLPENVIVLE
ncbi:Fc.00g007890.m01.CDS01 [Cosmosporella sp. VM-42]